MLIRIRIGINIEIPPDPFRYQHDADPQHWWQLSLFEFFLSFCHVEPVSHYLRAIFVAKIIIFFLLIWGEATYFFLYLFFQGATWKSSTTKSLPACCRSPSTRGLRPCTPSPECAPSGQKQEKRRACAYCVSVFCSVPDPWYFGTDPEPSDPYLWLLDLAPDPDLALFVSGLQDANQKDYVFCLLLFRGTFTSFFTDKNSQMSQNSGNQGFLRVLFCPMMGGSGSVPLTKGSGSGTLFCVWQKLMLPVVREP